MDDVRRRHEPASFDAADIILEGAGRTLTYRHGITIGDPRTLSSALADLTRLRIRGEYRAGADTGGIGFVLFGRREM